MAPLAQSWKSFMPTNQGLLLGPIGRRSWNYGVGANSIVVRGRLVEILPSGCVVSVSVRLTGDFEAMEPVRVVTICCMTGGQTPFPNSLILSRLEP